MARGPCRSLLSTTAADYRATSHVTTAPVTSFRTLTTSPRQQRPLGFMTSHRQVPAFTAALMATTASEPPALFAGAETRQVLWVGKGRGRADVSPFFAWLRFFNLVAHGLFQLNVIGPGRGLPGGLKPSTRHPT